MKLSEADNILQKSRYPVLYAVHTQQHLLFRSLLSGRLTSTSIKQNKPGEPAQNPCLFPQIISLVPSLAFSMRLTCTLEM